MSATQRAPLREPLGKNTTSRNTEPNGKIQFATLKPVPKEARVPGVVSANVSVMAPTSAATTTETKRGATKVASSPFVQKESKASTLLQDASGRENRPASAAGAKESGFAAARRRFATPTSQESSVMSRSKTIRKASETVATSGPGANRLRLSRQSLASFPSVDASRATITDLTDVSKEVVGSAKSGSTRWMDVERDNVQAYEYLCHCSEAQKWMEKCIGEPLGGDIANMGEEMRNGIALAKLAKSFEPTCVPRIFVHPRLQFRHTDNINYFFQFVDKIRLPNCFRFELTDVYEKKNFPKVVYCLHALSHYMAHQGRSDKVDDLVGKLEFDEEQLHKTQKTIDASGLAMPSFGGVGQALAQEMGTSAAWKRKSFPPPPAPPAPAPAQARERAHENENEETPAKPPRMVPEPATLASQRAHLKPVPTSPSKATSPSMTSLRANLKPVGSVPSLRSPDHKAHAALERAKAGEGDDRIARLARERQARMEERQRQREQEREKREQEREKQRKEREQRRQDVERERARKREEQERERERERERLRLRHESERELDKDRERRTNLYTNVRSVTQRELARERERLAEERALERKEAEERLHAAEERARQQEREREEKERFERELEYEMERQRQREAYAAELAAAHAETAAAEARLKALTEAAERREAAERARASALWVPPLQAAVRGVLARRAWHEQHLALRTHTASYVGVQAFVRRILVERSMADRRADRQVWAITSLQAHIRGALVRQALYATLTGLDDAWAVAVQASVRGMLARGRVLDRVVHLESHMDGIVRIQAAARGVLARRALLAQIESLLQDDWSMALQAHIRGALARASFQRMRTAFSRVEVVKSVNQMQTSMRAALSRRKHQEMRKQMEYVKPDVTGVQAHIRGMLARQEYWWWRDHLHASTDVAVYLQAMLRGVLARRTFDRGIGRYLAHIDDVIRVQSLCRARHQGRHYRALQRGRDVPLATVRAFADLLEESGRDYAEEMELDQLRTQVLQHVKENQGVEAHVAELDRKIALLVKNKIGLEEVTKAKTQRGWLGLGSGRGARTTPDAAAMRVLEQADDPMGEHVLSPRAQHQLDLYQSLFYLLQTQPVYLARLLVLTNAADVPEQDRRQLVQTVLSVFAYAQQPREEYLLLKLVEAMIQAQLPHIASLATFPQDHASFLRLLVQFTCGVRERDYLCTLLTPPVQRIGHETSLELEADPLVIQRALGQTPVSPDDDGMAALEDVSVRTEFLRRLQNLRATCEAFLNAMRAASPPVPYGLQWVARVHLTSLQSRFPHATQPELLRTVSYILYHSYMHPAIVAPESFGMPAMSEHARRNLVQVSRVLAQVACGVPFDEDHLFLQPLNEYVLDASVRMHRWVQSLVDTCEPLDLHYGMDEYSDISTPQHPVIYISPNEVYAMHQLLCNNEATLCTQPDDVLATLLAEMGPPPVSQTAELNSARDSEVTLTLSHRFAHTHDPNMDAKTLFVETKRLVLGVLRVQTAPDLVSLLVAPVTQADEATWERTRAASETLSFAELKSMALENVLHLEQLGRVSRATQYQNLLDAIAADIRSKHRRRLERQRQAAMLQSTMQKLVQQRAFMEDQIQSYSMCMDRGMHSMQKKTRRRTMAIPFSPQFFHERHLKAAGAMPKYGSYRYTASRLRTKGVLAHIDRPDNFAPDQLTFIFSSDEAGIIKVEGMVAGIVAGTTLIKMESLLEAQYQNQLYVGVLDNAVQFHLGPLIQLINKSTC